MSKGQERKFVIVDLPGPISPMSSKPKQECLVIRTRTIVSRSLYFLHFMKVDATELLSQLIDFDSWRLAPFPRCIVLITWMSIVDVESID